MENLHFASLILLVSQDGSRPKQSSPTSSLEKSYCPAMEAPRPPSVLVEDTPADACKPWVKGGGAGYSVRHYMRMHVWNFSVLDPELALEQLATHIPDLVLRRSPLDPVPQITHCYGVMMFLDVSGKKHTRTCSYHLGSML